MMDTVLNLGLNDKSVKGLAKVTSDERFAYDSYRRFISMYGRIVLGLEAEPFDHELEQAKEHAGVKTDAEVSAAELKKLCERTRRSSRRRPASPSRRTRSSSSGARSRRSSELERCPRHRLPGAGADQPRPRHGGQRAGHGVRQPRRQLGHRASASPATRPRARTSPTATSSSTPRARTWSPASATPRTWTRWPASSRTSTASCWPSSLGWSGTTEDMCDTEFTIEQGKLWMLQTRVGKRTGAAALRMAVDMTKGTGEGKDRWKISRREALMRITPTTWTRCSTRTSPGRSSAIAKGLAASPGAAVGKVYFTADDAADAADRGEKVILVRSETSPEDVHGMMVSEGILTARGGLVSHAAVVARGWGTPAVVGAEAIQIEGKQFRVGDLVVKEGDVISLDGIHRRHHPRRAEAGRGRAAARVRDHPRLGRRRPPGKAEGPRQRRQRSRRQATPATSAPRGSGCAGPSTCSSARTDFRWSAR